MFINPEWGNIIGAICTVGGAAGSITAIIALAGMISKAPKNWLTKRIKNSITEVIEETVVPENKRLAEKIEENQRSFSKDHQDLVEEVRETNKSLQTTNNSILATIRHNITDMYKICMKKGYITELEKKDLSSLYEQYTLLGGNSYVHELKEQLDELPTHFAD